MKSVIVLAMFTATAGAAIAAERVTTRQLAGAPKTFVGRTIVVPDIGCVDDPRSGFVCIAIAGGRALRIEASVLGAKTGTTATGRLISDCKGTANLQRPICRFDAEIEPTTAYSDTLDTPQGSMPVSVVRTGQIDLSVPRR